MDMVTITKIFKEHKDDYVKGTKQQKQAILDHVCAITGITRKAAIRKFRTLQTRLEGINYHDRRGRPVYYTKDVTDALRYLWEIASGICAERLHAGREEYLGPLIRDGMWPYGDVATGKLRAMSIGTMKSRITQFERTVQGGARSHTKPSDLKEVIPVRRSPWDDPPPGVGEIDTVHHSGNTAEGRYASTVQYTDVSLTWCLLEAQMGLGKQETREHIEAMVERLPVPLQWLDPDTGSEFINWHLDGWCRERDIEMTRIRPGKKDDHGRIEQKNSTNVRQFTGYIRIDTDRKLRELRELLSVLEVYINHFLPSMKCVKKVRTNAAHSSRTYDTPQTPFRRLMEHPDIPKQVKRDQQAYHDTLNPKTLHDEIIRLRRKLFKGATFTRSDDQ